MRAVVFLFVAACSFAPRANAPDAGPPGIPGSIVEDMASDFTGTLTGGVVDPLGALAPETYVVGGLHAKGFKQKGIDGNTDLDNLPDLGPSSGEMYGLPLAGTWPNTTTKTNPTSFPPGMNINTMDNWTVVVDGEIELPAGPTTLVVTADDTAVLEIATGSTPTRLAATCCNPTAFTVTAPAAGWYPIRGVFGDNGGDALLSLSTMAGSLTTAFPADHLRANTTTATGLMMGVFQFSELQLGMLDALVHAGPGLEPGPFDHKPLTPLDYPLTQQYSIRYQGQLRIDDADPHTIAADVGGDADDHYRVFFDDQLVASQWLSVTDVAPAPIAFGPGWHSFVIDYGDNVGNAEIHVTLDGTPLPSAAMRPTLVKAHQLVGPPSGTACSFAMGMSTCKLGVTDAPPGATIDFIDFENIVTGSRDFTQTLTAGSGSDAIALRASPNETELSTHFDYDAARTAFAGMTDITTWTLQVNEPTVGAMGTIDPFGILTVHGGPDAPFSPLVTYESLAHMLPDDATLGAITVTGALANTVVVVEVRTANDPMSLAAAPYTAVGNGMTIPLTAGKLVQFRVSTTTDGWSFATIDKVEIDYTTPAD